jgi:hypothetical protein
MGSRRTLAFAISLVVIAALGSGIVWFPESSRPAPPTAKSIAATPLAESHEVADTTAISSDAFDLNLVRGQTRTVAQQMRRMGRILARAGIDDRLTTDEADDQLGAIDDADRAISAALDTAAAIATDASTDPAAIDSLATIVGHLGTCAHALDQFETIVQAEVPPAFIEVEPFVREFRALADETAAVLRAES